MAVTASHFQTTSSSTAYSWQGCRALAAHSFRARGIASTSPAYQPHVFPSGAIAKARGVEVRRKARYWARPGSDRAEGEPNRQSLQTSSGRIHQARSCFRLVVAMHHDLGRDYAKFKARVRNALT